MGGKREYLPILNHEPMPEEVVKQYERLVWKSVRSHCRSQFVLCHADDLYQEGMLGLMRAWQVYDPTRGTCFLTYAKRWVDARIKQYLMHGIYVIKQDTTQRDRKRYWEEGGYEHALSLDCDIPDFPGTTWISQMEDESPSAEECLIAAEDSNVAPFRKILRQIRRGLPPVDREILNKRLLGDPPIPLRVIGEKHGISRERVRQREAKLLRKIKARVIAAKLADCSEFPGRPGG